MIIRAASPADFGAIRAVVAAAFGQPDEADLVDRLRAGGDALVELIAESDGSIVGHIMFSPLGIGAIAGAALAPLAVAPAHQRGGIGGALTRAGLDRCRALGVPATVVLGHPDYYPKFGFDAALAVRLESPFAGPSLMAIELMPGALAGGGRLRYAPAFGI